MLLPQYHPRARNTSLELTFHSPCHTPAVVHLLFCGPKWVHIEGSVFLQIHCLWKCKWWLQPSTCTPDSHMICIYSVNNYSQQESSVPDDIWLQLPCSGWQDPAKNKKHVLHRDISMYKMSLGIGRHGTHSFILFLGSLPDVRHGERVYHLCARLVTDDQ